MTIKQSTPLSGDSTIFVNCDKCGDVICSCEQIENVPDAVDNMGGWYEYDRKTKSEIILCRECGK